MYQTGCAQSGMPVHTRLCWDYQLVLNGPSACVRARVLHFASHILVLPIIV